MMKSAELAEWDSLVAHLHDSGVAWVEAHLKASQLEEDQKPFLASIANEMDQGEFSEAKLERLAKGSAPYRDYIAGMCAARADALRKKVKYESWQNLFEARRTLAATERVKIDRGIFDRGK